MFQHIKPWHVGKNGGVILWPEIESDGWMLWWRNVIQCVGEPPYIKWFVCFCGDDSWKIWKQISKHIPGAFTNFMARNRKRWLNALVDKQNPTVIIPPKTIGMKWIKWGMTLEKSDFKVFPNHSPPVELENQISKHIPGAFTNFVARNRKRWLNALLEKQNPMEWAASIHRASRGCLLKMKRVFGSNNPCGSSSGFMVLCVFPFVFFSVCLSPQKKRVFTSFRSSNPCGSGSGFSRFCASVCLSFC